MIDESQVDEYINKNYVRQLLDEHRNNKLNNARKIWTVLTFMVWHQVYVEHKYPELLD
ncbi:asparagine synthase-related protein [Paucilactobacillus hokkaidonensis]|uniref:asparagine synthase-related protein n=1 Tax=Paucilactobacillus hokkaidonensis TaxID=1193095 RepID=UPI003F72801C